jgi:hypothetical protein
MNTKVLPIDTSFDFRLDTPPGRDPDKHSATLRRYHQHIWNKPLPSGDYFELTVPSNGSYLSHRSAMGEFQLASDGIINSYITTKRVSNILKQVPPNLPIELSDLAYTIGGFILFPGNRIDNKMTINGARGCHRKIADRFDLTLECIRRHYAQIESPLSETMGRYAKFFDIFESFQAYVEFFLLQDLVTDNGSEVRFLLPFDNFQRTPLPLDAREYVDYVENSRRFLQARSIKMSGS